MLGIYSGRGMMGTKVSLLDFSDFCEDPNQFVNGVSEFGVPVVLKNENGAILGALVDTEASERALEILEYTPEEFTISNFEGLSSRRVCQQVVANGAVRIIDGEILQAFWLSLAFLLRLKSHSWFNEWVWPELRAAE